MKIKNNFNIFFHSPASMPKSSPNTNRPFTAMPTKTAPEDPPITSKDAWTGSSLVRTHNLPNL